MQTKLRITMLMIAAILLTASMISAASRSKQLAAAALANPRFVGIASWYGAQHQGRKMANGKRFDRRKLTAASWYLPMGTTIRVVNLENGKSVTVTITDRGPNFRLHRLIDLSEAAAMQLGYIQKGITPVYVSPIVSYVPEHAEVRAHIVEPTSADLLAALTLPQILPSTLTSPTLP
jgi:peptidoglycan lytic transglycosylase